MQIQTTTDGSQTIYSEQFGETYHSVNGAVTESMHVFIQAGLHEVKKQHIRIFETGFGTGLNALVTFIEAQKLGLDIEYHSIELYPLDKTLTQKLEFPGIMTDRGVFDTLHEVEWEKECAISEHFTLLKTNGDLLKHSYTSTYDLVFFDAFSPNNQNELWSEDIFRKLFEAMNTNGVLTTYCAKGEVRRTMQRAGFTTERIPGPPGKREMLRARKLS